jgi:hypothetical protein
MPKLLLFAPCEKVLINQQDNTTSLITLLEFVRIPVPESEEAKLPEGTSIPLSWHVFALWQAEHQDEGRHFEMRFTAEPPKGNGLRTPPKMPDAVMPIAFEPNKPNYRQTLNVLGFPILPAGTCLLKLAMREIGTGKDWETVATFPMIIARGPEPNSTPATPHP